MVELPNRIDFKLLKKLNVRDYKVIALVLIPAIVFLFVFFMFGGLLVPSILSALSAFIIIFYWKYFKDVFSASIIGIISFLVIILLFGSVVILLIKYNSGDIEWGVNIYEMFGLDK